MAQAQDIQKTQSDNGGGKCPPVLPVSAAPGDPQRPDPDKESQVAEEIGPNLVTLTEEELYALVRQSLSEPHSYGWKGVQRWGIK